MGVRGLKFRVQWIFFGKKKIYNSFETTEKVFRSCEGNTEKMSILAQIFRSSNAKFYCFITCKNESLSSKIAVRYGMILPFPLKDATAISLNRLIEFSRDPESASTTASLSIFS